MLRFRSFLERAAGRRGLPVAAGLGALAAAAMPPVHALPVLWLSLPGLLLLASGAASRRRAALLGLAWGWGFHVAGLYWITEAILTEADRLWWLVPLAVPLLALPLGAFTALPALAAWGATRGGGTGRRPGTTPGAGPGEGAGADAAGNAGPDAGGRVGARVPLAFAGAWVGAELLRGWLFTGFPWNLLGSAWAFDAWPLQGAAFVGVHGLSLLTALLALAPLLGRPGWLAAAVGLALMAGLGALRLTAPEPPPWPVALVLVQGNVGQEMKWRADTRWPIFSRYLELTREGAARAAARPPPETVGIGAAAVRTVAIWPETASPFLLAQDPEARRLAGEALPAGGVLLAGTVRAEFGPDGRADAVFNSLAAVDGSGALLGVRDKFHLVPFGEYMPLAGLLPLRVIRGGMDFSAGSGPASLAVAGLPAFSPLICYEVIFPGAVAPAARPDWLLNITNDAWFGSSAGPHQHLAAARLRAVEEGLPLARAAQTGISAVFDSRGRERVRLALGATGAVDTLLPRAWRPTQFARWGLWIPGALVLVALLVGFPRRKSQ